MLYRLDQLTSDLQLSSPLKIDNIVVSEAIIIKWIQHMCKNVWMGEKCVDFREVINAFFDSAKSCDENRF